ncbi:bridge-like lipid transfer protein family member 1 [Patella vulgata]|uniref:bridge-like lipid transfer protein family member 1 n=1 Tax=Patella vulgata TaxID=6465 RepID=UPI00217F7738|nr:bridge-like lipid transfer protein family member 1 [Patella vulgata]
MAIKLRMRTQNQTFIEQIEEELPESSVYYLLLAMLIAMAWTIYLTYYHSRVMGIIIGAVLNKFLRYLGHIKFGSFSFSVLSGKVMFRDFHIITEDYSLRIQYGWIIFRWWRPYVYKEINEDMSHSETRMSLFIDGLEFHVYNRSANYAQLEKFFGLKPTMVPECDVEEPVQNRIQVAENGIHWRDLIPVIKIDINSGRFIFGNYLVPYTLLASFEEAHLVYTTKPASTPFDMFMHVVKCKSENMKVMMVPSPNYRGTLVDEPPRNMGEGFVVMQSNDVDIYYYMDEPGLVPHEPELVEMADGEVVVRRTYPCLGIDIKCGKKTDFNYGPWVDRQREHLWKFFFPVDYQPLIPTKEPDAGQRRVYKTFETKINCTAAVTFDILFTKNSVTQAIHINAQQGSYVESIIPWMIDEDGYKTKIKGQLMLLDASTSMTFRNLAELETLEFDVTIDYPITWNEYQDWKIDLTGCKATVSLIYEHMNFFKDLVEDWSSKGRPDLYSFVPYTWSLNLIIKEFELIAATNEYNWIDTSSQTPENAQIAFCGEYFDLSVQLPFTDFLPNTIAIPLVIKGETVFCRVYLPESNTSRHIILALSDNMKIVNRDGIEVDGPFGYNKVNQWRKVTQISAGWVDCWWTSNVSLSISYTYHPMPIVESSLKMWTDLEDLTTPEKEETILQPLRPGKSDSTESNKVAPENFDASTWEPDIVNVELEVAPSVLYLYGSLLVNLLHLKENYVGEDQKIYDFSDSPTDTGEADTGHVHDTGIEDDSLDKFDPRAYRPFAVTVSVTLHDIQAQLVKNCNVDDVPCPSLHVERLCFEMDKSYRETKLQLLLSPCVLIARDNVVRDLDQDHLKEGYLALSGLQVRGHAMFSHEGLHLDTETLEYAWLVEVIIGEVTGKLTSPEIQNIAEFLQTFVMLVEDPENHLQNPVPFKLCQHMLPQTQCRMLPKCPFPCPSADDIKYRMVRVSIDSVNIYMVESGAAFNLKLNPVRLSTCNLHGNETRSGITAIVEHASFRQLISCVPLRVEHGSPEVWLEAGSFSFGPINVEAAMAIPSPEIQLVQDTFLKTHDRKTKRLWFMWPLEAMGPGNHPHTLGKCGCQGGCRFFGNNKNGVAFFRSRRHRETSHAAIPQVCGDGHDPGFAQSLLHKDKLVFDVSQNIHRESPTKTSPTEFSFTRGYMSDIASPDTPGDPISKIFDSSIIGSISEHDSTSKRHSGEVSFSSDSKTQLYDPNEKLEPACKITPDVSSESGVTGKHSPDSKALGKTSLSYSNPSSPIVSGRLGSRTSFSSVNKSSSKTSLPSPISVHSTDGITRMTSTVSLESQQYYSAEEDLTSSEQDSVVHFSVFDDDHSLDSANSFIQSSPSSDKGENNNSMATTVLEQTVRMNKSDTTLESSSSSTLSYESAGSVNSAEGQEEFSLVDLHNQMNQPITSSALLLSCYSNHLSHYHCNDWVTAPPSANLSSSSSRGMKSVYSEYSLSSASHSVYGSGSTWLPHFTKVKDGFSTSVMREKEELKLPSPPPPEKGKNQFFFPSSYIPNQEDADEELNNDEICPNTSKTTAVIKVTGALDVLLTPLLLESMQRYIETVTPTLSKLHISSLLDRIHSQCIDRLKQQNKLKKESTKEEENVIYNINDTEDKQDNKEVAKTTSFRAFFSLPKINICVLQASIVEEVISFSMLENISDVTAVSLLAVCVDNIKCQLLTNTHSCKILPDTNTGDVGGRRASAPPIMIPASGHGTNKIKSEVNVNESDKEQTGPSEATREENVGILQISRIHTQLRRLVKESNFSDNIILTAIPDYRSNVLFSFNPEVIVTSPMGMPGSPRRRLSRQASRESNDPDFIIGFIMFECGLEDVSVTAVRRLGYKADSDLQLQQKMDNIEQTLQNLQETTKEQIEQQTDPSTSPTDDPLPHSSPSAHHSSLSMSSSWNSRVSFKSDESDVIPLEINIEPLKGDASNGRLDLKTIWLNFAAPPPISIKKKVDFTRMDWNLLSTATPSINAWMNPSDRAMVAVRNLVRVLTHRTSSVIACIMTEALEVQGIHVCNKTKFGKATNLSKTLQEEPSCQLLTVLRKYLRKYGTSSVEQSVSSETIPNLITMQKGILALTRQWKNVLYMPYLSELNFKNKKNVRPYNVTFALPGDEESTDIYIDDGDGVIDQFDVVDEKTSLLQAEGGSVHKFGSNPSLANKAFSQPDASHDGISSVSTASIRHKKIASILTKKGSKGGLPHILSCVDSPERKPHVSAPLPTLLMTRNESTQSFASVPESLCSSEPGIAPTPPPTPMRQMGPKQSILKNRYDKSEDLYQWMAKQQEDLKMPLDEDSNYGKAHEGWLLGSSWSQDESRTDINEDNVTMATSIMQLADAQMLFKPLLQSLGLHVEGVRPSAMMKKFGGHLLLQGHLEILKVQIAESEDSKSRGKSKSKGKGKRFRLNINASTPAFQCEGFGINICMKDVIDFGAKESFMPEKGKSNPWKFAMHKLEAKPTTLQVNFLINCQRITQHVDMSLLRLVHQFVTMVDNIKDTQVELKKRRPSLLGEWTKTHRKQESKDSTSSADTQQSDLSKQEHQAEVTLSTPTHSTRSETPSDAGDKTLTRSKNTPSFKLPMENIRPERLSFSSIKKPHLRFARDKSKKDSTPGQQSEILTPPQSLNLSDTVTIDMVDTSSPALAEKTIVDEIKESTPRCWRHLYHLLELYSTMPETKTVLRKPGIQKLLPVIEEEPEKDGASKRETTPCEDVTEDGEAKARVDVVADEESRLGDHPPLAQTSFIRTRFKQSIYIGESIPLVVYGIAKVERVQMLAVLSGLKLEAELRKVHASGTYKEKVKGFVHRKSAESSFTAHVGHTMIVLLEGVPPNMQTVVTVNIGKSQALHTTVMRRSKEHNSALASVGVIDVDIPQHPVVLHGMMTRSSKKLTSTLQEFRRPLSRIGKVQDIMEQISGEAIRNEKKLDEKLNRSKRLEKDKPVALHIHFKAVLQGFTIGASILPSLKAQHKTGCITVAGMTGKKARFTVVLPKHTLSFKSKVTTTETSIPSSASIEMPPIHIYADYRTYRSGGPVSDTLTEGLVLKEGSYLNAVAEVGMLEHSLTTDLLNHLVFVQKVFMKEVNEVVQKVSGSDQPVHLWADDQSTRAPPTPRKPLLYSFSVRFKGIQVTATTPTSNAVRLETGEIELEMSNRVQMASRELNPDIEYEDNQKVFIRAQIDLNVSLGQLLKNPVFEEAEPEFQTMAFFKTKIGVRNAIQDEMIPGVATEQEALLITVSRPIVLAQPLAFDKAVLVWLNYKNAYEYWTEQRMALNNEVQTATRQVFDRLPQFAPAAGPTLSTLFLQLTVDDMGICVPLESTLYQKSSKLAESEPGAALVLTVESTQISACSSGSLVSKGRFKSFCLRFADDFETSLDDWKPNTKEEPIMNVMVVKAGTYEVCSRTDNKQASDPKSNAKWILNVQWEMQGLDVHFDTDIGKRLSALGHTLTALAGETTEEDEYNVIDDDDQVDETDNEATDTETTLTSRRTSLVSDILPDIVFTTDMDPKERVRQIEREMNEQAKIVQDLRDLGASQSTIEAERKKLEELQALVFRDFRRDVFNKIKKQSERASAIKDKLGIGMRPAHVRSRSYGGHHGRRHDSDSGSGRVLSKTLDNRHNRIRPISADDPFYNKSHVQFGSTYPPPSSAEARSMSLDVDMFDESNEEQLTQTLSLQDIKGSDTDVSLTSSNTDSEESLSRHNTRNNYRSTNRARSTTLESSHSIPGKTTSEPSIDFELDIKVFIDSGKCVLYPKEAKEEEVKKQLKREKSGGIGEANLTKIKRHDSSPSLSSGKKTQQQISTTQGETTVFFLPSVDVKVHYNSKTTSDLVWGAGGGSSFDISRGYSTETPTPSCETPLKTPQWNYYDASTPTTQDIPTIVEPTDNTNPQPGSKRGTMKRANLYAWLSLNTLPEEMIISPCLLDFLEQALEPLPISQPTAHKKVDVMGSVLNMELDASHGSLTSPVGLASFPVDVVVFIRVERSMIRFNCIPISRVECVLNVPSLELVFSTKKADVEVPFSEGTPPSRAKVPKRGGDKTTGGATATGSRGRLGSTLSDNSLGTHSGGLSVTGTLSNFSLYIFHPYGGGQRRMGQTASPSYSKRGLGSIQETSSSSSGLIELQRKDSLSLNVEFIKVNISRSRKMDFRSGDNITVTKLDPQQKCNMVRFSAVCDIGAASFKYDMRRLSEILSLPKAWYRRNLARRLFLGDDSFGQVPGDGTSIHHQRSPTEASTETYQSPNTGRSSLRNRTKQYFTPELPRQRHTSAQTSVTSSWETLVLFAVNLSRLELDVNMSNVMGNTMWTTKEVKSQGRLSIDSSGHKNLKITAGLGGSSFESRGGVIGGAIDLQGVHGLFQVKEDPDLGHDPDHRAGLTLEALEGRVDYMGSSVLMTRLNNLDLLLRDDWHVERETGLDTPVATKRSAYLFVNGDLSWDQFHIMISRSTTPDLIKLVSKLEEFFTQQLTSSKRVLSAFGPLSSKPNTQRHSKLADDLLAELRHHRHWQGALEHLVGCRFSMLSQILPEEGMVLGGSVTLKGEHLCLASFHGINFRSKSWALFSIRQPYISFSTEAQKTENDNTHIVQDLSFIVGGAKAPDSNGQHMVTICKLSRGHYVPQQFTSVQEWFTYAFATNEIKELDTFPVIIKDRCRPESPPEHRKTRKSQVYNHETEIIFGMPSMTLNLKTSHLQGKNVPVTEDAPPVVECTFVTEFYDHINVAMDAEVILFLHDLVLSYIKEKDKGARMSYGHSSRSPKSPDLEKKKNPDPTAALKQDWRDFRCKAWQLEPTVRLLHWASRQIDPVGVDYVLQKLGFTHARVTIPKWVQRGFMDPVDKVLSVLVDKLIVSLQDPPDADEVD